ncbi:MAG: winged helix-turn-helix transcriptional regulator [Chloroflexi bacterium]|nr:winged helix-turn-helix transcriptional regulator [Chloroflexota bacterium]
MELDTSHEQRELILLEQIEEDPDVSQATLADRLDVAVGTVNWHIKRLVNKGYIKLKRAERKKLRYIITPEGIAFRAHLTVKYIENSMLLFRRTRRRVKDLLSEVRGDGYDRVQIVGDGDLAEVIRLTCIEQGIRVDNDPELPVLEVRGWKVYLNKDGKA